MQVSQLLKLLINFEHWYCKNPMIIMYYLINNSEAIKMNTYTMLPIPLTCMAYQRQQLHKKDRSRQMQQIEILLKSHQHQDARSQCIKLKRCLKTNNLHLKIMYIDRNQIQCKCLRNLQGRCYGFNKLTTIFKASNI